MHEERRYKVHNNWEPIFQPSAGVECGRSWGSDELASEGQQEPQMDSNEAAVGSEVGDRRQDGR